MDAVFAERVEWELTRACDLRCSHCYNTPGRPRPAELDTREALDVAAELGRLGCRVVTLSGGEPTLRSDWPQIAEALSNSGIIVQLITNGQRFGPTEARLARRAGVGAVQLSVDGCATTHDAIRGRPGAFVQVEAAAHSLREVQIPLGFITTVQPKNEAELEALAPWVARWDPVVWQIGLVVPQAGCREGIASYALPDLVRRLASLQKRHAYLTAGDNVGLGDAHHGLRRRDDLCEDPMPGDGDPVSAVWHCEAGRGVLGLRSDGSLTGCLALPASSPVGSFRETSLQHLWIAARRARRRRLARITGACGACEHLEHCGGGCHAMALASTGHLDNPYCLSRGAAEPSKPGKSLASVAASLAMATLLGAGCGPRPSPQKTPPSPPPTPPVDAAVADAAPTPDARPPTPRRAADASVARPRPAKKPIRLRGRACMYTHIGCYHLRHRVPRSPTPKPATPKPRRRGP